MITSPRWFQPLWVEEEQAAPQPSQSVGRSGGCYQRGERTAEMEFSVVFGFHLWQMTEHQQMEEALRPGGQYKHRLGKEHIHADLPSYNLTPLVCG